MAGGAVLASGVASSSCTREIGARKLTAMFGP